MFIMALFNKLIPLITLWNGIKNVGIWVSKVVGVPILGISRLQFGNLGTK
jgi:hypothetical protein